MNRKTTQEIQTLGHQIVADLITDILTYDASSLEDRIAQEGDYHPDDVDNMRDFLTKLRDAFDPRDIHS